MRYLDINDDIRLIWLARFGFGKMLDDTRWIEKNSYDRRQILMRHGWGFDEAFDFCFEGSENTPNDIDSAARKYAAAQAKAGNMSPHLAVIRDLRSQNRKYIAEQEKAKQEAQAREVVKSVIADLFAGKIGSKVAVAATKTDALTHVSEATKVIEESIQRAIKKSQEETEREIVRKTLAANRNLSYRAR